MQGYQVTFFTQEGRRYHGKQLSHWLMQVMHEMPVRGATRLVAAEGLGHDHRFHSWHFIEIADRPEEVTIVATAEEVDALFERLSHEQFHIFYAKTPVEFGVLGKADS
ncbi:putative ACR [compost metagenome]